MRPLGDSNPWASRPAIQRHSIPFFQANVPYQVREDMWLDQLDYVNEVKSWPSEEEQFAALFLRDGFTGDEIVRLLQAQYGHSEKRAAQIVRATYTKLAKYLRPKPP